MQIRFILIIIFLAFSGFISGCSDGVSTPVDSSPTDSNPSSPPTSISLPATDTLLPTPTYTNTALPPTETNTPQPTVSPSVTSSPTAISTDTPTTTPSPTSSSGSQLPGYVAKDPVRVYMIAPDASGSICGGTAVGLKTGIEKTNDLHKDIEAALNALIHTGGSWVGSFYNPLSHSQIRSVSVSNENGKTIIQFRGTYNRTDDPPCNNSLVRAQVWSTIKQFGGIQNTDMIVYMNSKLFGDLLVGN